jgi:hypothetical protein
MMAAIGPIRLRNLNTDSPFHNEVLSTSLISYLIEIKSGIMSKQQLQKRAESLGSSYKAVICFQQTPDPEMGVPPSLLFQ